LVTIQVVRFPDKIGIQGFNPNRTVAHAESPQLAQEKSGLNGAGLSKQPLNPDLSGNFEPELVTIITPFSLNYGYSCNT